MLKALRGALIFSALILVACGSSTAGSSITTTPVGNEVATMVAPEINPRLILSPESAAQGQHVTVTGDGWPPDTAVALTFRPGSTVIGIPLDLGATIVDRSGFFHFSFYIPSDAAAGDWMVRAATASDSRSIQIATAPLTVLPSSDTNATATAAMPTASQIPVPPTATAMATPTPAPATPEAPPATATIAATNTPAPEATPEVPPATSTVAAPNTPAPEVTLMPTQPITPQRVRFPEGATSITLTPVLSPGVPVTYVLGILGGQILTIQVNPAAHISILDIQGQVLNGAEQTLSFQLPYTGDYIIVIDSIAVADPATVQISIPPPQTPPP
jgi:hypothetical protein